MWGLQEAPDSQPIVCTEVPMMAIMASRPFASSCGLGQVKASQSSRTAGFNMKRTAQRKARATKAVIACIDRHTNISYAALQDST